jgi:YidC/Oxa1 family membrane protein insertase
MQNPGGPAPGETRNVFIALALSAAIMFGFEFFYNAPQRARLEAERARVEQQQTPASDSQASAAPQSSAPVAREAALAASAHARVAIDTAAIDGSISLEGARIDDLSLRGYNRTIDPASGEVTLLAPMATQFGHDAFFGWEVQTGSDTATLADVATTWTAPDGARLTPATPVTLTLSAGPNLTIERTIAIDDAYMFTITDVVRNSSDAAISVRPFGVVRQHGLPQDYKFNGIIHQGLVGAFGPNNSSHDVNFRAAIKHAQQRTTGRVGEAERIEEEQGQGGWFGITDHYWLAAIIPDQAEQVSAYYDSRLENNETDFRAAYRGQWRDAPSGGEITYTQRLYAGAKRVELLQRYQHDLSIPRFDRAVDWGNFWFLTRPFFLWLLHPLGQLVGNFGIAILLSTIVIKAILFPLVYQSFKSMAKMRALQPKMKELQERYAADKQRQQQELLRLYQTEKINPVSGCIPILLQIPVFYALYKTLSVTIEMRHAPFYGWINDLSAPDPTSIFNIFGLLPALGFDFHALPLLGLIPAIGVWPILYGVSMWALQALSPPPTDPVQAQVFRFLPILFTFMFASFAAGMVIYWTWSNTLSMLQQYVIMRRQGVETQLDKFIAKQFGNKAAPAE